MNGVSLIEPPMRANPGQLPLAACFMHQRFESLPLTHASSVPSLLRAAAGVPRIEPVSGANPVRKQGNEFSLAHQVKIVRESMGYGIPIERLYFAHARGSDDRELAAFFGTTEIIYGAGVNGVDLAERALASTSSGADASLFRVLEERARDLIAQFSDTDELEPVRRAIVTALEQARATRA